MSVLNRANIAAPVLPKETIDVPEIGGEVVVQGLLLSQRLQLAVDEGEAFTRISAVLAATVVDAEGKPIWTAQQWEVFGARHDAVALKLVSIAQRLSGMANDSPKESAPS